MVDTHILKRGCKIQDFYKIDKVLGEGTYGQVKLGINKKTNEKVAIKIVDKSNLEFDDQLQIQNEIEILAQVDHPNIVKLFEVYDQDEKIFIVMELMTGGELFDRIVEKEFFTEQEACEVIKPIVEAIKYCHEMGVAHRDLKPENLLYSSQDSSAIIKITDFGISKVISTELMQTACGTPNYLAPEIIQGLGYSYQVDYWAIGVIIYILLCGYPPFSEDTNEQLFKKISSANFVFDSPQWDTISTEVKDLLKNLLVVDPQKRYTADQILNHSWMKQAQKNKQSKIMYNKEKIKNNKFQKLLKTVI